MKYSLFFIAIICTFLNTKTSAQATFKGKIINGAGLPLTYIVPVHGSFFLSSYAESQPDTQGDFSINITTDTTAFIPFYCNNAFWRIIIAPNEIDSIFIDLNKPNEIEFFGKNALLNQFLNSKLKREKYFSGLLDTSTERSLLGEFTGAIVDYKINKMRDTELVALKNFVFKNKLDTLSPSYKILFNDIRYYHASLFNALTISAYRQSLKEKTSPFDAVWATTWDRNIAAEKLSNDDALASYWYHDFTDKYIDWYRASFKKEIDVARLDIKKGENIFEIEQLIRQNFTGKALEATLADMIHEEALQGQMQPSLVSIYNRFYKDYPNSHYIQYLTPVIRPIADAMDGKPEDLDFLESIYLIDNQDSIKTIDHLLSIFKGKVVYVDLWATWCAPCKEEFRYKHDLENFVRGKNIEKLYISIDKADKNQAWEDAIGFYNLSGHHIRASSALIADIRSRFAIDSTGAFTIPRYLIVDTEGKIVVQDAKRPSEKELLYEQIKTFLK
jgi:thiol-disulfide isomerase/thioredoxin